MTNTTPTPDSLAPNAYAGQDPYVPAPTATGAFDRWRWLLAGVIGILGGYLMLSSVSGPLLQTLSGFGRFPLEQAVVFVLQAVFALAVTAFAYIVAPGSAGRRVLAIVLYTVLVAGFVAFMAARLFGDLRIGGPVLNFMINTYFAVLFAGALCWLIAAGSRPIAYLSLLLTFVVMPLGAAFAYANLSAGWSQLVQLVLCLVIAVVVLLVSRPPMAAPVAPAAVATEPVSESPS
jgi:hypothetical protein